MCACAFIIFVLPCCEYELMDIMLHMQIVGVVLAAFADVRPTTHDTPPGDSSTDALNAPDATLEVVRAGRDDVGRRCRECHVSAVICAVFSTALLRSADGALRPHLR